MLVSLGLATGCMTLSGNYKVSAIDANGVELVKGIFAQGGTIYIARNAICSLHKNATVIITDLRTGHAEGFLKTWLIILKTGLKRPNIYV